VLVTIIPNPPSVLTSSYLAGVRNAPKPICRETARKRAHSVRSAMCWQRKQVEFVRTECRRARRIAVQFCGDCGYPTMYIKNNSVIVNSGGMSENYLGENRQHNGMNREKKRGPHNMQVSPSIFMKTRHRKKVTSGSPVMFLKRQYVTRRIRACFR